MPQGQRRRTATWGHHLGPLPRAITRGHHPGPPPGSFLQPEQVRCLLLPPELGVIFSYSSPLASWGIQADNCFTPLNPKFGQSQVKRFLSIIFLIPKFNTMVYFSSYTYHNPLFFFPRCNQPWMHTFFTLPHASLLLLLLKPQMSSSSCSGLGGINGERAVCTTLCLVPFPFIFFKILLLGLNLW